MMYLSHFTVEGNATATTTGDHSSGMMVGSSMIDVLNIVLKCLHFRLQTKQEKP